MDQKSKTGLHWVIAAGVVGADIGTSVFYGTGILFPKVGYLAPVFVLTACLMMWLFKKTYEEGLALSPYNGGAYSMILRTVGRRFAVVAGSLTFVSYLATAAVSALSGGFYLNSLFDNGLGGGTVVLISFFPIILFGLLNTRGIKEPAKLVTVIAGLHFLLLIIMGIWGLIYIGFNIDSIDWTKMSDFTPKNESLTFGMLMYGFAAAFLGITGFESAAQIVEELEQPTLLTVRRLYRTVIVLVSVTAPVISFLCLAILTRQEVDTNLNSLLSSLADKLGGRILLTIIVVDATLTLFAAVNTAFVGFIGLATTMAKQGNLPEVLLTRVAHKHPTIQGYPLIALPFALVAMTMSGLVAGEVEIVAKVYEMAFLGVMVSFCLGVVLMRNRSFRRNVPTKYLSHWMLSSKNLSIPVVPLISGVVLGFATLTLMVHADESAILMLETLFAVTLLVMAYYRWGVLENRLETRTDLRLGLGRYSTATEALPEDLPRYILCTGGTGARRLITTALKRILSERHDPFELVIFHAEDGKDPEGFFFELLQRVVSQQIAPIYAKNDVILTVKILPGSLAEGLQTLKKTYDFQTLLFGSGRDPEASRTLGEHISEELEIEVIHIE
ncbi:MAG: APC family permease [Pseudobdellovibrionaceae bacterium]|nr:APC family permease [Bdellovibrionales bacterium]USN47844.1 MAG: APC family permease [Pseudobdellovibrionaceae bacterium]